MASKKKISETEIKILFAKSGNVCAFPCCKNPIIAEEGDEIKPLAEMAHIIAREDKGPRSDPNLPIEDRNKASNLILFCPTHHTLVDKFEYQYNVHILREMKRLHEAKFSSDKLLINRDKSLENETLFSSLLPITRLPLKVYLADTPYRKNNVKELFDVLNTRNVKNLIFAFELMDKKLYTFSNLYRNDNPFCDLYDKSSVSSSNSTKMWASYNERRLYVALLNRALSGFLRKQGLPMILIIIDISFNQIKPRLNENIPIRAWRVNGHRNQLFIIL